MATPRQKRKVKKVMGEYQRSRLESGAGRKVKNRKPAIAMSGSGQSRKRRGRKSTSPRAGKTTTARRQPRMAKKRSS